MNAKKIHPLSKAYKPAKVATTLTTGSDPRSTKDTGKTTSKATGKDTNKATTATDTGFTVGEPSRATARDVVGIAMLVLPPELREILGPKHLQSNALELETQEILVIVREDDTVTYVHLPIMVKELDYPDTTLRSGMVLNDITGPYAKTGPSKTPEPPEPSKPSKPLKANSPGVKKTGKRARNG